MKAQMQRNIILTYLTAVLGWARFYIPVLALFYIASQVSLEQFTIIMSVFSLSILVLEIPTGVIADLLGRKNTLLISRFFYVIELFLIAFYNGFWVFLIAKIISGVGVSLWSGSEEALIYDTLKRAKREKEYKKINGIIHTISNVAMAIMFVIGGFLFAISPKLPAIASVPFAVLGFALTFFLTEPYKSKRTATLKNSIKHMKEGAVYFWHHSYVKYLTFYSWPIAATIAMMLSISSAYHQSIMIPVAVIGVIVMMGSLLTAYAAKKTHYWEELYGEKKMLLFIQLLMIFAVCCMSLMINYIGAIFYLIICFGAGLFNVLISHYVNQHIKTSNRATMLSIKNFFDNLAIFIFFPILGYIIKYKSMSAAFVFWGISLVILIVALWFYSKKLRMEAHRKKCV